MTVRAALRSCWRLVPAGMGWRWAALVPLALVTVALEAAAALAVYALTRVIAEPTAAATIPAVRSLVRHLPAGDARTVILAVAVATALLYLLKNAVAVVAVALRSWCVEHATAATATALLRGYLSAPWSVLARRSSGRRRRRLLRDRPGCAGHRDGDERGHPSCRRPAGGGLSMRK